MATVHDNAVIVKLLNFLDGGQAASILPVVLVDEGFADAQDRLVEGVAELNGSGVALVQLRVSESFIDGFHL